MYDDDTRDQRSVQSSIIRIQRIRIVTIRTA